LDISESEKRKLITKRNLGTNLRSLFLSHIKGRKKIICVSGVEVDWLKGENRI
jgi:hypothetical protein